MNELEQDKKALNFLACNFEKQKNEKHFTFGVFFRGKKTQIQTRWELEF